MLFLFPNKRNRLFAKLVKAFPKEYATDVKAVCSALSSKSIMFSTYTLYRGAPYSRAISEWQLLSGEKIKIPYRIYMSDQLAYPVKLTPRQTVIYHCIFSRSYDGYMRQKHIEALLLFNPPAWAMPFVIKLCDEYVKEILETIYQTLQTQNCNTYKALCEKNFKNIALGHCRMISHWNEYYRNDCYRYRNYVGKKLYRDCFGYCKTGQKSIQR